MEGATAVLSPVEGSIHLRVFKSLFNVSCLCNLLIFSSVFIYVAYEGNYTSEFLRLTVDSSSLTFTLDRLVNIIFHCNIAEAHY